MKLVYIEDDKKVADVFMESLQQQHRVVWLQGTEGLINTLAYAKEHGTPFDCCVTDAELVGSVVQGIDVPQWIGQKGQELPVILLSGQDFEFRPKGFLCIVKKGFDSLDDLDKALALVTK